MEKSDTGVVRASGTTVTTNVAPTKQRYVLVFILLITLLVAYLDRVNVSVLAADVTFLSDMGIKGQPIQMGMLMTLFLIAYGFSNVLLSPLGDILGPRKAMSLSIALWGASLFIGGFAVSFSTMLVARVILGLGEGMHWPMQSSFVKNWFPPHERGKANAVWLIGLMVGPAIAMPFFTWIIQDFGWRASFFVLVALGAIPLLLLWFYTTDFPHQHKLVNKAERDLIEEGQRAEKELEAQAANTTLWDNMKVFIFNYRFWLITIFYFCLASIFWGTMAWLPSYLKVARGFSWVAMGAWSSLPYVLGVLSVVVFGYVSDKIGRRAPLCAISMLGAAAGIYFGAHAPDNTTAAILVSLGIASIGIALPSVWTLLQQIVPGKAIGAGAGMMNGISNGGSAFAPVLIGFFISVTGSYVGGLMFLVGLGLLAAVCMLILSVQKY
ncbi:putative sulfoacetate transporter SauU [bioreactor metagenome]|uniref:Putative sulfoacetate transporter SauU n=1 Tax=bioreactor metagenome TaxID=1076179 RepID=A0A644TQN2_9ZZZZ|nr:MFS transporter [Negativicutes bacterium]